MERTYRLTNTHSGVEGQGHHGWDGTRCNRWLHPRPCLARASHGMQSDRPRRTQNFHLSAPRIENEPCRIQCATCPGVFYCYFPTPGHKVAGTPPNGKPAFLPRCRHYLQGSNVDIHARRSGRVRQRNWDSAVHTSTAKPAALAYNVDGEAMRIQCRNMKRAKLITQYSSSLTAAEQRFWERYPVLGIPIPESMRLELHRQKYTLTK